MSVINKVLKDLDTREPLQEQPLNIKQATVPPDVNISSDWLRVIVWAIVGGLVAVFVGYLLFFDKQVSEPVAILPVTATLEPRQPEVPVETLEIVKTVEAQPVIQPETEIKPETEITTGQVQYLPLHDDSEVVERTVSTPVEVEARKNQQPQILVKKARLSPIDRAREYLAKGRLTEAEVSLKEIVKAEPSDINARELLIGLLLRNQRTAEAEKYIQDGLRFYPYRENLVLMQVKALLEKQDIEQAISLLKKQVQMNRATSRTLTMLAPLYQQRANYAASASVYQQLVRNIPEQATNWVGLGISLEALSRKQEAVNAYRQALQFKNLENSLRQYSQQRVNLLTQQGVSNE